MRRMLLRLLALALLCAPLAAPRALAGGNAPAGQATAGQVTPDGGGLAQRTQIADTTTPRKGVAVAAPQEKTGTVPLFRDASESEVLMEYYSGARFEVVGFSAGGDMAQVQAGVKGASIMGYMRAGDLRYGAKAEREVPLAYMAIVLQSGVDAHAYPDPQAPKLGSYGVDEGFSANSRNDGKWVQLGAIMPPLRVNDDSAPQLGFVHLPAGTAMGYFETPMVWTVDPVEGELTYEEAYARAMELLLERADEVDPVYFPPEYVTPEALATVRTWINLPYDSDSGTAMYQVEFKNPYKDSSTVILMHTDGTYIGTSDGNG